jgi:hypothetical protein
MAKCRAAYPTNRGVAGQRGAVDEPHEAAQSIRKLFHVPQIVCTLREAY